MFVEAINCTDGKHPLGSRLCCTASLYHRDASYSVYSNSKSREIVCNAVRYNSYLSDHTVSLQE
jgi:hypothetical protein